MEPIDLCGSSSSSGSSGTASRLAGQHVRRRTPRLAAVNLDQEKSWNAPIVLDFSEPDELSNSEPEDPSLEFGEQAGLETGEDARKVVITEGRSQAIDGSLVLKESVMESPLELPAAANNVETAAVEAIFGYVEPTKAFGREVTKSKIVEDTKAQWVLPSIEPITDAALESTDGTECSLTPPVARPGGAWKPLKKKDSASAEPCSVSSFFCKAKPETVIKLVQQVVSEQEKAVPTKRSWKSKASPTEPLAGPQTSMTAEPGKFAQQVGPEVAAVAAPENEEKPSWARLLDDQAVQEERQKSDLVAKGLMDPTLVPKALRRVTQNKIGATVKSAEVAECDIDPALQAALKQSTATKEVEEDMLVDMHFTVDVIAKLIEQDLAGPPVHKPLAFKISNKTTFGNIKTTYCNSRKISARGLLLTHKDVPLFDSVTVSASGLVPEEMSSMLELVLYDKMLFDRMKAEQQRVKAATMEILKEQVPEAVLDVSAYMQDNDLNDSTQATFNGLLTIKVIAGKNSFEAFRIAPSATLSDLLHMYLEKHPETPTDRLRFIFDGDVLQLTKTIEGAELEDGDQLELRT